MHYSSTWRYKKMQHKLARGAASNCWDGVEWPDHPHGTLSQRGYYNDLRL